MSALISVVGKAPAPSKPDTTTINTKHAERRGEKRRGEERRGFTYQFHETGDILTESG